MGEHVDAHQLTELSLDLKDARGRIQRSVPKVLETGSFKIKQEMQQDFSGHSHLPRLERKVSYNRRDALGLWWEIGIDKGGVGDLGNFAAYGSSNNAPVADKNRGLRVETPHILRNLAQQAQADALEGQE